MTEKKRKYYININPLFIDDARDCREIFYDSQVHRFFIKAQNKSEAEDFEIRFNTDENWRIKIRTDNKHSQINIKINKVSGVKGEMSITEWEAFLNTNPNGIDIATKITEFGIPENSNIRIGILNGLNHSKRDSSQYPITYRALIKYSESFRSIYSLAYIQSLISEYKIIGASLDNELIEKNITGEEAEILKFVLEDI